MDLKILITIHNLDMGKTLDQLLSWLKVGLRVFTDDKYSVKLIDDKENKL